MQEYETPGASWPLGGRFALHVGELNIYGGDAVEAREKHGLVIADALDPTVVSHQDGFHRRVKTTRDSRLHAGDKHLGCLQ
jgi:hypothetical protein